MRKDSEVFLRKCLQYREEMGKDSFELTINYFSEIPNIEAEIDVIIEELKRQNCISKRSALTGEKIRIYLTLDGIIFFNSYKGKEQETTIIINGDQINVATDNGKIVAKKDVEDIKTVPKIVIVEEKNERVASHGVLGDGWFWLSLVAVFVLTKLYLDYRLKVQMGLVIASIIIEVATVCAYYSSRKARVIFGKNIKQMSRFNMVGILCVPLLIGIINIPLYTSIIDLDTFKRSIDMDGMVTAFSYSEYSYYALFQMIGMIFLTFFMAQSQILCDG